MGEGGSVGWGGTRECVRMRAERLMGVVCAPTDQLKKNPVVSNDELNQIQSGLGDEAMKEFGGGQGGLGAMLGGIGGKN